MSTNAPKQYCVSWDEFHQHCLNLSKGLLDQQTAHGPWQGIIGVARGGLVPAAIVARELNIRLVDSLSIATYQHDNIGQPNVLKAPEGNGGGWLVIDDLVDTGTTAKVVRELLPNAYLACVYAKPKGKPYCDLYEQDFPQDTWIHFPWDCALQFSEPMNG